MKSPIILFYINEGADHLGRTHDEILNFSDDKFDACHDFIQWLFPLHEESRMTDAAVPIITKEDHEYFRKDEASQYMMEKSLHRFRKFLNNKGADFWCNNMDHNLLMITRVIRSLRLFGMNERAEQFHDYVKDLAIIRSIDKKTIEYWDRALNEPMFNSLY